jgi:hypothetical protein
MDWGKTLFNTLASFGRAQQDKTLPALANWQLCG